MRTIILLIVYTLLVILAIPLILFCYLLRYAQPLILYGKGAMHLGKAVLGIRLEVHGREKIDKKKSYLFMPNHVSFLDGPLMFMIIPQPGRVLLKKEIFKIPIVGQGMKLVGFIPVDRKGFRGGKRSIDLATRLIKEKGFSFLIFPEGTRSRDGKVQPFKRGGFFLAVNSQTPIVPVTLRGSFELMPKGTFFVKKGKISIAFHPPVEVHGFDLSNLPELMERVQNVIQCGLA